MEILTNFVAPFYGYTPSLIKFLEELVFIFTLISANYSFMQHEF
jgi:hypothetical protein